MDEQLYAEIQALAQSLDLKQLDTLKKILVLSADENEYAQDIVKHETEMQLGRIERL